MKKNLITKISVIIFTMGISFAGLNFVSASACSDSISKPTAACAIVSTDTFKCRSDPSGLCWSNGCDRDLNDSHRFNDNLSLVSFADNISGMTQNEIDGYNKFITYFSNLGLSIGTQAGVRKIQETINILSLTGVENCPLVCEDGRFGNETINALENGCLPCGGTSNGAKLDSDGELTCEDGYSMDDQFCCNYIETECYTPYLLINGSPDTTTYSNADLEVTVDYSSNEGDIDFDTSKITVVGGDINSDFNIANKLISFSIGTIDGTDSIIINVDNGCAILTGNLACPPIGVELNRCNAPTTSCESDYGDGWTLGDDGCCFPPCGSNEAADGAGGCECNEAALKCADKDQKKDPNACKCVCDSTKQCCGIELNTVVPFIGDCIEMTSQNNTADPNDPNTSRVNQLNAFPFLMMGMSKILVTVILIFSFLIVIVAGLMMVTGVYDESNYKKGMERIKKVVVALILLGSSGLILRLINPNFFGG